MKLIGSAVLFLVVLSFATTSFAIKKYGVVMYDDEGFADRELHAEVSSKCVGPSWQNLRQGVVASGKKGFNDKATSVKWYLPKKCQCVMYENDSYSKRKFVLRGNGTWQTISHLGWFSDKASSFRCMKRTDPKYD